MAATTGAMTSLPTSQILFTAPVEEPEQNRINFRDSLKFFQEQLVINGGNFPSPSTCRTGNDSRKNGPRSYKAQNENSTKAIKNNDLCENEIQSTRSCRISIPTVDTILESVRVLRAIQKSQQERGSTWNLDATSQSDIDTDFQLTDEWIHFTEEKQELYPNQESDYHRNYESTATDSTHMNSSIEVAHEIKDEKQDITNTENECSAPSVSHLHTVNEICPFWPSNTLLCEKQEVKENAISKLSNSDAINEKEEFSLDNINLLNNSNILQNQVELYKDEKGLEGDANKLQKEYEQDNTCINDILNWQSEFQTATACQSDQEKTEVDINTEICDMSDSESYTCKNFLHYANGDTSDIQENSKEQLQKPDSSIEMLKIEMYDNIDTQKGDFLLNETIWKDNCSQNESNSIKIENNDSDSGIGTQRSASSLSPNNPIQMRKDSWSDTCSSHYASAECSPYHSLNSVFESSQGFSSPQAFTKEGDDVEISTQIPSDNCEESEKSTEDTTPESDEQRDTSFAPTHTNSDTEYEIVSDEIEQTNTENVLNSENRINYATTEQEKAENALDSENMIIHATIEQEKDISHINFVTNYTLERPTCTRAKHFEDKSILDICDNISNEPKIADDNHTELNNSSTAQIEKTTTIHINGTNDGDKTVEEDSPDTIRIQKFTASSCDMISIVESLYTIKENPAYQVPPTTDGKFEEMLFVLSQGAFCDHPENNYLVKIEDSILYIEKDTEVILSLSMKYGEVSVYTKNMLKIDNKMGRCVYIRSSSENLMDLKAKIEFHCLKHWQSDCLQLVHYPLKCHQNVIIIDLGSCSTRAGILMDQPTLPSLFFPTICATDRATGKSVYGMEALQPEVRQHSNLSFPVRPSIKITKHTIAIDSLEGLFKKIFHELQVVPSEYTVQVCLPRNLSINAQNDLVKLLLENLKVKAVSLTNQALLTLYAHEVSTAIVVDIGDRTDVLPVVDGFIVENGVTKLPHGSQRLIHHMKHSLAEKHISLSNEVDSFVVQYIIENLAYVAEDFDSEIQMASKFPEVVKKTIALQPMSKNTSSRSITLDEARFKVAEGLFNPEMWGLDSPGIHHLVQKAIQATSVDVRKKIAQNIYVSGGVTMLPGFVERLKKEVTKLSKAKIVPKVYASNYRYHCTYIGACKFAKMGVFPQVCVSLEEYSKNNISALKKFALYF